MSTSVVPVKCYYGNEIRRISLAGQATYPSLVEQLQAVFSIPPTQQLRLRWQDEEGDKVAMSSTAELHEAVRSRAARRDGGPGDAVKLFLSVGDTNDAVHEGVRCDGCESGVTGLRFKCLLCPDFDLCSACMTNGCHSQHPMLLIRRPGDLQPPGCQRRGLFGGVGGGGRGGGGCGGWRRGGGCRRGGAEGCGPRFRDFFAKAAEAAEAAAAAVAADLDASASAASGEQPAPPPPRESAAEAMATDERPEESHAAAAAAASWNGDAAEPPADPRVARALEHMRAMGFSDDGGWLTRLLEAKEGDISAVLDAIRPAK